MRFLVWQGFAGSLVAAGQGGRPLALAFCGCGVAGGKRVAGQVDSDEAT